MSEVNKNQSDKFVLFSNTKNLCGTQLISTIFPMSAVTASPQYCCPHEVRYKLGTVGVYGSRANP